MNELRSRYTCMYLTICKELVENKLYCMYIDITVTEKATTTIISSAGTEVTNVILIAYTCSC